MRKRIIPFSLFLLIIVVPLISGSFQILYQIVTKEPKDEGHQIVYAQVMEKEGEREKADSYEISLLKQLKVKVDGWLKSLNERIEREDITRFEVRFLEISRNILEWVKEKIDAKLESSETEKEKMRRLEGEKEGKIEGEEEWISPRDFIKRKVERRW